MEKIAAALDMDERTIRNELFQCIDYSQFIYRMAEILEVKNTIYYLARLLGDDPEGNPDVKDVRDLSSTAEKSALEKKSNGNFDISEFYLTLEDAYE